MLIRVAYIKRGTISNGCQVAAKMDVDVLPRVGDTVLLSDHHAQLIRDFDPYCRPLAVRRFSVIGVEHKWDRLAAPLVDVIISTLRSEEITA